MNVKSDTFCASVSVDGTWQKHYGFSSLHGVVFIVAIETGEVLDYEVRSKVCYECRSRNKWDKVSQKYQQWFEHHKLQCSINHEKSAESMEKDAAGKCSIDLLNCMVLSTLLMWVKVILSKIWRAISCVERGLHWSYPKKDGGCSTQFQKQK